MQHTDAIVIGAGQAGLAMSHCLTVAGIDHLVLERGLPGQRWRTERWDRLRLLTPNWMSRLPGWSYQGSDPDGYMTMPETVSYLERYAHSFHAPVITGASVHSVHRMPGVYRVESYAGTWRTRCVIIATGQCDTPLVPQMTQQVSGSVLQLTPTTYRNAHELPDGDVLIVGASASGIQLAAEIQQSGRQVTVSVGHHTRLPRVYRGRDIMWWMDRIGILTETVDSIPDLARARAQPSFQLIGRPDRSYLDLNLLQSMGARIVGRARDVHDGNLILDADLAETTQASHRRLERLLSRIDEAADAMNAPPDCWPGQISLPKSTPSSLRLGGSGVRTIIWATGFRRNYQWLHVPVLDAHGEIIHVGGITPSPGLYVLGLRLLRRRNSNFLDGVGADAIELTADVQRYLSGVVCAAA
ncbi:MAG: NAD(P)-binding domain-containing protein [Acetobacteraceae bacterium]